MPKGSYKVGQDVTEVLGVTKYETATEKQDNTRIDKNKFKNPIFKFLLRYSFFRKLLLNKKENKGFPTFLKKTDEPRIQNLPRKRVRGDLFNRINAQI